MGEGTLPDQGSELGVSLRLHPHPRAANLGPRLRLSVSFPRTLLPGPQPPPRCPVSSAAGSSGTPANASRVSWRFGDWTWKQIARSCAPFITKTSKPGTGRPSPRPRIAGPAHRHDPHGGATVPARGAEGRSSRSGSGRSEAAQTSPPARCPRPTRAARSPPAQLRLGPCAESQRRTSCAARSPGVAGPGLGRGPASIRRFSGAEGTALGVGEGRDGWGPRRRANAGKKLPAGGGEPRRGVHGYPRPLVEGLLLPGSTSLEETQCRRENLKELGKMKRAPTAYVPNLH